MKKHEDDNLELRICIAHLESINYVWFYNNQPFNGVGYMSYPNGKLDYEANYKNGVLDGLCRSWYLNGQLVTEGNYKDGKLISEKCWDEEGNEIDCE